MNTFSSLTCAAALGAALASAAGSPGATVIDMPAPPATIAGASVGRQALDRYARARVGPVSAHAVPAYGYAYRPYPYLYAGYVLPVIWPHHHAGVAFRAPCR